MTLIDPDAARFYLSRRIDQLRRARRIIGPATVTGSMVETMIETYQTSLTFLDKLAADHCLNQVTNLQREAVTMSQNLAHDGRVSEEHVGVYLALSEIMLATDGIETLADMKSWGLAHGYDFESGAPL